MANLKSLRLRINSVASTRKITRAMQMVSTAKLRRAKDAAEEARPYAEGMEAMITNIAASMGSRVGAPPLLAGRGPEARKVLLVVATAERGLCGGFNSSIARLAARRIRTLQDGGRTVQVLTVGRKGREALQREYGGLFVDHVDFAGLRHMGYGQAKEVAQRVIQNFESGESDVCSIFFNRFRSAMSQVPTERQLIPVLLPEDTPAPGHYEYEEDEAAVLAELLPKNVAVQVFSALLENAASEQGARMTAMDSATRNAGDMIERLTREYNRSRQAAITTELIEIIAGAEAL